MKILCHRGYWKNISEKNAKSAFLRGYALGLGTETDIRDVNGQVVISHDPALSESMLFTEFLEMTPKNLMLALNVKSDGLACLASAILHKHAHKQFFFFDMSIPDLISYRQAGLSYAVRVSEYEKFKSGLEYDADFIWLDGFMSTWYTRQDIDDLLSTQKSIVIVSEELHGRSYASQWETLRTYKAEHNIILCTDYPEKAIEYFGVLI